MQLIQTIGVEKIITESLPDKSFRTTRNGKLVESYKTEEAATEGHRRHCHESADRQNGGDESARPVISVTGGRGGGGGAPQKPSPGRVVIYQRDDGKRRPAIVVEVRGDGSCDLEVFGEEFLRGDIRFPVGVVEGTNPGTWSWPPRV